MKTLSTQILMWTLIPFVITVVTGCASQPTSKADASKAEKSQRIADRLESRTR